MSSVTSESDLTQFQLAFQCVCLTRHISSVRSEQQFPISRDENCLLLFEYRALFAPLCISVQRLSSGI